MRIYLKIKSLFFVTPSLYKAKFSTYIKKLIFRIKFIFPCTAEEKKIIIEFILRKNNKNAL